MKSKGITTYLSQDSGFTLIELLMVVIILGILAAVAIPQLGRTSHDAKISALKSNLNTIRGAIELYAIEHDGVYPDSEFANQMTLFSNKAGATQDTKTDDYAYGPYLKNGIPKNPFVQSAGVDGVVLVDTAATQLGATADPNSSADWTFVSQTGEFIANGSDTDGSSLDNY